MTFHWSFLLGPMFSPFDRQQLSIAESLLKNAEFSRQVNVGRDHQSGRIIATSHDLGPKKLRKGNPLISGKSFNSKSFKQVLRVIGPEYNSSRRHARNRRGRVHFKQIQHGV